VSCAGQSRPLFLLLLFQGCL